mmetsp:Transcript_30421/g.79119  ORF Transcript_30421/g.79119 Transcript_30421/m.79119 type:complete len:216 (+) Transcript_30421:1200-1847(+)
MPGIMPAFVIRSTILLPFASDWKSVSQCRMTPEMYSLRPGVVYSIERYAARFSAVSGIFAASTWPARSHGPADSSLARKPLPGALMASAVALSAASCSSESVVPQPALARDIFDEACVCAHRGMCVRRGALYHPIVPSHACGAEVPLTTKTHPLSVVCCVPLVALAPFGGDSCGRLVRLCVPVVLQGRFACASLTPSLALLACGLRLRRSFVAMR